MKRKRYSKDLKTKVALMALKAQKSSSEIASEFGIHVRQVNRWKNQAIKALPDVFGGRSVKNIKESFENFKISLTSQELFYSPVKAD